MMAAVYSDSDDSVLEILTAAGAGDISTNQFGPVYTAKHVLHREEARERAD